MRGALVLMGLMGLMGMMGMMGKVGMMGCLFEAYFGAAVVQSGSVGESELEVLPPNP